MRGSAGGTNGADAPDAEVNDHTDTSDATSNKSDSEFDIYVDLNGNDSNPGTKAKPFLTIERAKLAARKFAADAKSDINIILREGAYNLSAPIILSEPDSGRGEFFVNYGAYKDEKVSIGSSKRISGWEQSKTNPRIYTAKTDGAVFQQLYVRDTLWKRAQYPKATGAPYPIIYEASVGMFKISASAIAYSGINSGNQFGNVQVVLPQLWDTSKLKVIQINYTPDGQFAYLILDQTQGFMEWCAQNPNAATCPLTTDIAGAAYVRIEAGGGAQPFYFENSPSFLSAPGEWVLDPDSKTVYIYAPNDVTSASDLEKLVVRVPITNENNNENIFILKGSSFDKPVKNIRFKSVKIAFSNWSDPDTKGHVASIGNGSQRNLVITGTSRNATAISPVPAAVYVSNASGIEFSKVGFSALSGNAVHLSVGVQKVSITGSTFENIGSNAIYIEQFAGDFSKFANTDIKIHDNSFTNIGVTGFSAAAVYSMAKNVSIMGNKIIHTSYSGIMTLNGCNFNALSAVQNINIENNDVRYTNKVQPDGSAIYSCGNQPNLTIKNNTIAQIHFPTWFIPGVARWSFGLYLDWGNTGALIEGNKFIDVPKPFNLNCEGGNLFKGNIPPAYVEQLVTIHSCPGIYLPSSVFQ